MFPEPKSHWDMTKSAIHATTNAPKAIPSRRATFTFKLTFLELLEGVSALVTRSVKVGDWVELYSDVRASGQPFGQRSTMPEPTGMISHQTLPGGSTTGSPPSA